MAEIEIKIHRDHKLVYDDDFSDAVFRYIDFNESGMPTSIRIIATEYESDIRIFNKMYTRTDLTYDEIILLNHQIEIMSERYLFDKSSGWERYKLIKLSNALELLIHRFWFKEKIFETKNCLVQSLISLCRYEFGIYPRFDDSNRIDIWTVDNNHTSIGVNSSEWKEIYDRLGVQDETGWATPMLYGNSVKFLTSDLIYDRVIPAMMIEYMRLKQSETAVDDDSFFNFRTWQIGVH